MQAAAGPVPSTTSDGSEGGSHASVAYDDDQLSAERHRRRQWPNEVRGDHHHQRRPGGEAPELPLWLLRDCLELFSLMGAEPSQQFRELLRVQCTGAAEQLAAAAAGGQHHEELRWQQQEPLPVAGPLPQQQQQQQQRTPSSRPVRPEVLAGTLASTLYILGLNRTRMQTQRASTQGQRHTDSSDGGGGQQRHAWAATCLVALQPWLPQLSQLQLSGLLGTASRLGAAAELLGPYADPHGLPSSTRISAIRDAAGRDQQEQQQQRWSDRPRQQQQQSFLGAYCDAVQRSASGSGMGSLSPAGVLDILTGLVACRVVRLPPGNYKLVGQLLFKVTAALEAGQAAHGSQPQPPQPHRRNARGADVSGDGAGIAAAAANLQPAARPTRVARNSWAPPYMLDVFPTLAQLLGFMGLNAALPAGLVARLLAASQPLLPGRHAHGLAYLAAGLAGLPQVRAPH